MKFIIEKNIPTPTPVMKTAYPFAQMKIGDSFFIKDPHQKDNVRIAAIAYRKRVDATFVVTVRAVDKGWRLWRIKLEDKRSNAGRPAFKLKTA